MPDPEKKWTKEQLESDDVTKKQIVEEVQRIASSDYIKKTKMGGQVANAAKKPKEDLVQIFEELFISKEFRDESAEAEKAAEKAAAEKAAAEKASAAPAAKADAGPKVPTFTKNQRKKGDAAANTIFPKKGDQVTIRYKGSIFKEGEEGFVFDNSTGFGMDAKKKPPPFKCKLNGRLVTGFEDGLLTMTPGEVAIFTIPAEFAYGAKGQPEAKIPPNSALVFEVELMTIN